MARFIVAAVIAISGCTTGTPSGAAHVTDSVPRPSAPGVTDSVPEPSPTPIAEATPANPTVAAVELLDCDGSVSPTGGAGADMALEGAGGGATPDEALDAFLAETPFVIPVGGYEPLGRAGDRYAYGYRAGSEVKVVVVVSPRFAADIGAAFVLEELRACPESEFGSDAQFADGRRVWTHVETEAILTDIVGPGHCGWQTARLLHVEVGDGSVKQYVRDPAGVLGHHPQHDTFSPDVETLPDDAIDSGYRTRTAAELWFTESDRAAYVVIGDTIERWPRAVEPIGCA